MRHPADAVPEGAILRFFAPGEVKGQPRPKALRNGIVYIPPVADDWKHQVRASAVAALLQRPDLNGLPVSSVPFGLELLFVFARPKSHWCAGKKSDTLRPTAPRYHMQKPDWDNAAKAVADALGEWKDLPPLLWMDDSQVVAAAEHKVWAIDRDEPAGLHVTVRWGHL